MFQYRPVISPIRSRLLWMRREGIALTGIEHQSACQDPGQRQSSPESKKYNEIIKRQKNA
jgi:hypothetical protein